MTKGEQVRLTAWRLKVLQQASDAQNVARVCRWFGISRKSFYKWKRRHAEHGDAGLGDRPRTPLRSPRATPREVVSKILYLRQHYHFGPARIAAYLRRFHGIEVARSSVHRILTRHGMNRLPAPRTCPKGRPPAARYVRPGSPQAGRGDATVGCGNPAVVTRGGLSSGPRPSPLRESARLPEHGALASDLRPGTSGWNSPRWALPTATSAVLGERLHAGRQSRPALEHGVEHDSGRPSAECYNPIGVTSRLRQDARTAWRTGRAGASARGRWRCHGCEEGHGVRRCGSEGIHLPGDP